jgi:hypothetical protein
LSGRIEISHEKSHPEELVFGLIVEPWASEERSKITAHSTASFGMTCYVTAIDSCTKERLNFRFSV